MGKVYNDYDRTRERFTQVDSNTNNQIERTKQTQKKLEHAKTQTISCEWTNIHMRTDWLAAGALVLMTTESRLLLKRQTPSDWS